MTPLLFLLAVAAPTGTSDAYRQCMESGDAARGNQTAITLCVGAEQAFQEARMNRLYDAAMDRVGLAYEVQLRRTQDEWRVTSVAHCTEVAAVDRKGNASGPAYARCMLDETIARADWIAAYSPEPLQ